MSEEALRRELKDRRRCLVGAKQTIEMVAATLENASSLDVAKMTLGVPVRERGELLAQAIEQTDAALAEEGDDGGS